MSKKLSCHPRLFPLPSYYWLLLVSPLVPSLDLGVSLSPVAFRLASYGNGTLTSVFLDCLFQECLTFGGEMDYKMYMDFVLAMENKDQPRSLAFFFRSVHVIREWRFTLS